MAHSADIGSGKYLTAAHCLSNGAGLPSKGDTFTLAIGGVFYHAVMLRESQPQRHSNGMKDAVVHWTVM
eukprot:2675415-Heterocapsa_arctica.AAC.1